MKRKVSIVIPCYNDFKYIERAVNSARSQTYANKEIIVIDDGSNSKTKEILIDLKPHIDNLITQENKGVVAARNKAIKHADGKYILTLDSDDYFEPQFLEKAVEILEKKEKTGMVTSWISLKNIKGEEWKMTKPSGSKATKGIFHNNAPGSLLFRKQCWEEVGGYDKNLWMGNEDWEFNLAVTKKGWAIDVIPEVLFNYQQKKSSRNSTAKNYQKEIRQYTFKKHHDLLVNDMGATIDFFLNEIELKEIQIAKLKKSKDQLYGKAILTPFRKIKALFKG